MFKLPRPNLLSLHGKVLILWGLAGLLLEKVKMSDTYFLPCTLQPLRYSCHTLWIEAGKKHSRDHVGSLLVTGASSYIHFQVLIAASGIQHCWCWSWQQCKPLLIGLATALLPQDQLCNVICSSPGEVASKLVYPTLSGILRSNIPFLLKLFRISFNFLQVQTLYSQLCWQFNAHYYLYLATFYNHLFYNPFPTNVHVICEILK